jgi:antitoxin VapB
MSMNIKNEQAHRLALKLSQATGESLTEAVTQSIRERLERVTGQTEVRLSERLLRIGRDCAARLDQHTRSVDHGRLLYDGHGLPK